MASFNFLEQVAAKAPILAKTVGKVIDAHGDGDGILEVSDIVDTVSDGISTVVDFITDLF